MSETWLLDIMVHYTLDKGFEQMHLFFPFWLCQAAAYRNLVPWPGIEPTASAVKAQSANHWAASEFPSRCTLMYRAFFKLGT